MNVGVGVGVIVAVRGAHERSLTAALEAHAELSVSRRCADLSEALAAAHAGLGHVVVLGEHPHLDRAVLAEFAQAGVVVVGMPAGADAADHLTAIGVEHLIKSEGTMAEAAAFVFAAAKNRVWVLPPNAPRTRSAADRGKLVAVWGPTGAPGRTTLAANIAAELGALGGDAVVADIDTYGGAVAQAFGMLDEAPGVAALARASLSGTLTPDVVHRHALSVGGGLRVLSGMTRADRWPELSAAALEPVWEALRDAAPVTVLDCGFSIEQDEALAYDTRAPQRNGATISALKAADVHVVVGSCEPTSIQRLVQALEDLDALVEHAPERLVVVNRLRSGVAGMYADENVADALLQYAGVEKVWMVPEDPWGCDAATRAGQSLRERSPRSAARKAIVAVATHISQLVAAE